MAHRPCDSRKGYLDDREIWAHESEGPDAKNERWEDVGPIADGVSSRFK